MNDEDRFVEDALARAALLLRDPPDRLHRVRRARNARQRRRRVGSGALVVVLLAAVGTGVVVSVRGRGSTTSTVTGRPGSSAGGDELGATGTVVAVAGHAVRFCDPIVPSAEDAHLSGPSSPPPSDDCAGVDVAGVNLARLADRAVQDGVVSGQAELTGSYIAGVLHVVRQGPPVSPPSTPATYDDPPCPTPAGGWAMQPGAPNSTNPDVTAAQTYQAVHPSLVQQVAVLRPSPHLALVYVLTNGDPSTVRASLAAAYRPDQLCVTQSRYTAAQIAAASADPALTATTTGVVESDGFGIAQATGQPVDEVSVVVVTPAVAAAVRRHPAGLLDLSVWLGPVQNS